MRQIWRRFGRVRAMAAVVALYGLGIAAALLLPDPADATVTLVMFGVFVAYCVARPHGGRDLFLMTASTGAVGTILHETLGISRWWGLALLPLVLAEARDVDRTVRT